MKKSLCSNCASNEYKMKRCFQLDALRGIAVALVVVHHWTGMGHAVNLGNVGVQLFFALSGFLITGILLNQRVRLESNEVGLWRLLSSFFERRAVRIWPVLFLTLAFVWLAGDRFEPRGDMLWHAFFSSNLLFFQRGEFGSQLAHFWTLAVEAQFYLVWPFAILLVPRKWLEPMVFISIAAAPLIRIILVSEGYTHFSQYNVLPFANLDSLGIGALMALWQRLPPEVSSRRWWLLRFGSYVAIPGLVVAVVASDPANIAQTMCAVLFGGLICAAHSGIGGLGGRVLGNRLLVALGTISYGVYVYHMFAPRAAGAALRAVGAPVALHAGAALFLISAILTLLVALISWWLMERPLLTLGKRATQSERSVRPM